MMNSNITKRIPIDLINQKDKYINVKLEQNYDFLETLSLKLDLVDAYKNFSSDYGCVVGRVSTSSVGIPNVKVSIFLEKNNNNSDLINTIYPFESISDKGGDGIKYNLLPNEQQSSCHTPVGTFSSKRKILDNTNTSLKVFDEYFKYSTVTNAAGDFMIFGVPVGTYNLVINLDTSDIGYLSQLPYDLINQGYSKTLFESPTKYKNSNNLDSLSQIITQSNSVTVVPFWTNSEDDKKEVGITRSDFDVNSFRIEPTAFFIGSVFTDSDHHAITRSGRASKDTGHLDQLETSEGKINILRQLYDGSVEELSINGGRLIDNNGVWCFQIPMNLDYKVTDEFGNLIDSEDPTKGIPTTCNVRFKIELDDNESNNITTGKYLIPNNPNEGESVNYSFNESCFTSDSFYSTLKWNKIYSVKNFITRYQKKLDSVEERKFIGLKSVNESSANLNMPFNKVDTKNNPFFSVLCILTSILVDIVKIANPIIKNLGGKYIYFTCNDITYKPSCKSCSLANQESGNSDDLKNCIGSSLAKSMQIFSFDFYNNWLNGGLYFPKIKYKTDSKGKKNDFSDVNIDVYKGRIVDICNYSNNPNDGSNIERKQGLFKYNDIEDEFYYTPTLEQDDSSIKTPFLRTDIINLGSVKNCDIDGLPLLYKKLKPTTFNKSPLITEKDGDDEEIGKIIGLVGFNTDEAMILNIGCIKTEGQDNMCTNLTRLCELGVGLDGDQNKIIDNSDIDSFSSRKMFMYCNGINDINLLNGSFNTVDYDLFRNYVSYNDTHDQINMSSPNGNSFYFYFGLKQGKTALDKLKNNFLTDCIFNKTASYYMLLSLGKDINGIENIINVDINGGVAPYTIELYSGSTLVDSGVYNGINNFSFTNLSIGTYKVVSIDSRANSISKEIYVSGQLSLDFTVSTVPTSVYNVSDGKIVINKIFNGKSPYNITISGQTSGITNLTITGTSTTISNLPTDNYNVEIVDGDSFIKSKNIIVDSLIKQLTISNTKIVPQSCPDGLGKYTFNVVGGVPPYQLNAAGQTYNIIPSYLGLVASAYTLTITDNSSQNYTGNFTIPFSLFDVGLVVNDDNSTLTMTFSGSLGGSERDVNISLTNGTVNVDRNYKGSDSITLNGFRSGDIINGDIIDNNSNCVKSFNGEL